MPSYTPACSYRPQKKLTFSLHSTIIVRMYSYCDTQLSKNVAIAVLIL